MKKLTYLFLALLLPGLIFVFLKYAGSNRFDIPIYYQEGPVPTSENCAVVGPAPYRLPDSLWNYFGRPRKMASVLIFSTGALIPGEISDEIWNEIGKDKVTFDRDRSLGTDSSALYRWQACVFLVKPPWQTVLFDSLGRIRGYYDLRSREEVDRLRVELKILVEHY